MSQNNFFFTNFFFQINSYFKIISKLVFFFYHIIKIIIGDYNFKFNVKTMIGDYSLKKKLKLYSPTMILTLSLKS